MSIEQERLNAFQARMNGWVSTQGLLFQLRHGGAVHGAKSSFMAGAMRLLFRLGLLMVLLTVGFWIYLSKRVDMGGFRDGLGESLSVSLGADSVEIGGVSRVRGFLQLAKLNLEGGQESFFDLAEMRGARTRMGLMDGVLKSWSGGSVEIKELRVKVKSGAESDADASDAFLSLFKNSDRFQFDSLSAEKATVIWGYSKMHRGGIQESELEATREGDGWRLVFTGGQFSQNWMRGLEIERIVALVSKDGVSIPEMKLNWEEGTVNCQLEMVKGGGRPEFKGAGSMKAVPIWSMLDPEYHDFVQGRISGNFEVAGSTNSLQGIGVTLDLQLDEGDKVELRDRFSLFRQVSAADRFRSYKRVRLTTGRCKITTGGGQMKVDDLWFSAPDLMRLEGSFNVRPPTDDEVQDMLQLEERPTVGGLPMGAGAGGVDEGDEFTLKRAGNLAKDDEETKPRGSIILSKEFGSGSTRELENDAMLRQQQASHMEGLVRVGLTKDAFSRSESLEKLYPVGDEGLRWIDVVLRGNIYTVGVKEAELLYERSLESR